MIILLFSIISFEEISQRRSRSRTAISGRAHSNTTPTEFHAFVLIHLNWSVFDGVACAALYGLFTLAAIDSNWSRKWKSLYSLHCPLDTSHACHQIIELYGFVIPIGWPFGVPGEKFNKKTNLCSGRLYHPYLLSFFVALHLKTYVDRDIHGEGTHTEFADWRITDKKCLDTRTHTHTHFTPRNALALATRSPTETEMLIDSNARQFARLRHSVCPKPLYSIECDDANWACGMAGEWLWCVTHKIAVADEPMERRGWLAVLMCDTNDTNKDVKLIRVLAVMLNWSRNRIPLNIERWSVACSVRLEIYLYQR